MTARTPIPGLNHVWHDRTVRTHSVRAPFAIFGEMQGVHVSSPAGRTSLPVQGRQAAEPIELASAMLPAAQALHEHTRTHGIRGALTDDRTAPTIT
jgi:hypothetical protein